MGATDSPLPDEDKTPISASSSLYVMQYRSSPMETLAMSGRRSLPESVSKKGVRLAFSDTRGGGNRCAFICHFFVREKSVNRQESRRDSTCVMAVKQTHVYNIEVARLRG